MLFNESHFEKNKERVREKRERERKQGREVVLFKAEWHSGIE